MAFRINTGMSVSGLLVFGTITSLFAKIGEFLRPLRRELVYHF